MDGVKSHAGLGFNNSDIVGTNRILESYFLSETCLEPLVP
jgi:hypothetical protein